MMIALNTLGGKLVDMTSLGNGRALVYNSVMDRYEHLNLSSLYEPTIPKSTGYLKWTGSAWQFVNETYAQSTHHHDGSYQPLDGDLTSIAALAGTSGMLRKTAANTWTLDTSSYLTAITKAMVEGVLIGTITSHNHDGAYLTGITKAMVESVLTGAITTHTHSYEPIITKSNGYLKWNGSAWQFLNETYLTAITKAMVEAVLTGTITSHNHDGTYITGITKAMVEAVLTGAITSHTHAYIPTSHTVNSIANGTGFLKNNGSGTWSWDNASYLTAITKAMVEAVLTGTITTHDHAGTYEPSFSKNTAFNKNFGTAAGTVAEGNDARLSDNRTPTDASVSYPKLASDLVARSSVAASDIDWNAGGVFTKTMTGDTTFTFSNLRLNKVVTLILTGDFTITLPSYCKRIEGEYSGAVSNYIQFHCVNAASGSEEVWFVISQEKV